MGVCARTHTHNTCSARVFCAFQCLAEAGGGPPPWALELRARLVVLSECDSFRGKLSSDGVIGITRAFVAAGAPTLVASLWKVDDAATRELMRRFYARLLEGGAVGDATAAMQGAMVSMIRDPERGRPWSVLEWAAFVVYGL